MIRKEDITEAVRNFIIENFLFGTDADSVNLHDSFIERGIIDSTGILEMIEFLETTYDIKIENDELLPENLDSLENISRFILSKTSP